MYAKLDWVGSLDADFQQVLLLQPFLLWIINNLKLVKKKQS